MSSSREGDPQPVALAPDGDERPASAACSSPGAAQDELVAVRRQLDTLLRSLDAQDAASGDSRDQNALLDRLLRKRLRLSLSALRSALGEESDP